jgi:hypothetical protein
MHQITTCVPMFRRVRFVVFIIVLASAAGE